MSHERAGAVHGISDGGLAASHPPPDEPRARVAPTTSTQPNTIRAAIIPVACWRVEDLRFEFGSSAVRPEIKAELVHLATLVKEHPRCPLSVFGHADPIGSDDYNKALSGRRAMAIYGLLTRNADIWEGLYSQPLGDDTWGTKTLDLMLTETAPGGGGEQPARPTAQERNSCAADPQRRRRLFLDYMDALCGPNVRFTPQDFLAKGADPRRKGDVQGCGEFNPVLIFSQRKAADLDEAADKTARNAANAPNRRVMVMLFREGSRVDPERWPCPRAGEGGAKCLTRFWSDGETRRTRRLPDTDRSYKDGKDTFACRFYDRLLSSSPCERAGPARQVFRFGFSDRLCRERTHDVVLHVESADETHRRIFTIAEGTVVGRLRMFTFADARPGLSYRGYLVCGDQRLLLFEDAKVDRITDPDDPYNVLTHAHQSAQ